MPTLTSGDIRLRMQSATRISPITWRHAFGRIKELSLSILLRSGPMYDLYGLNQPIDVLPVTTTDLPRESDAPEITARAISRDLALRVTTGLHADRNEVTLDVHLAKTGPGSSKFQLQFEASYTVHEDHDGIALVLPAGRDGTILRPFDASDQEIFDQDSHTFFPKTVRLSRPHALLASTGDRKSILFTGTNVRYVAAWRSYRMPLTRFFTLYGYDSVLDEGDEHAETFRFRLIPCIGGACPDGSDALAGAGALLQARYLTSSGKARVCFTAPQPPRRTAASLARDGKTLLSQSGTADLELDTSDLEDGEYTLTKQLHLADKTYETREPLTVLRRTYQDFSHSVEDIESFLRGFDPDAQPSPHVARVRLGLLSFKLDEIRCTLPCHEIAQIRGLIADAQRVIKALQDNEPAALPPKGDLIHANDFSERADEFQVFGNGEITFTPENGMLLQPVGTMDLWTRFDVAGSFMVEFDYFPFESRMGGTMVQFCATHPNPISQYDFMCSASYGSMAYYMFGIRCYHFSFSRWGGLANRPTRICNFRKTGKGFYVLSLIPDPIAEPERWYHLTFVKDRNHFMFFVDDRFVQEYFDEGNQGPLLDHGRIGIRNWSTYRSHFKSLAVHANC